MKILSKITLVLAFVCTLIIMNPLNVEAATGRILFNDPTVAAGEEFDLTVKVLSYDDTINSVEIDLKYDSSKIEFISGSNSTAGNDIVKISTTATGAEKVITLKCRALKKGDTTFTILSQTITTSNGEKFTIQEGNSAISVEGGTEVESTNQTTIEDNVVEGESLDDTVIQVAGVMYEMSEEFLESEIPVGYTMEKMEIRGENISVIKGDTSGVVLVYLEAEGESIVEDEYGYTPKGRFFRFDEITGKFSPYVQITVSDSTYIIFLTEDYEVELPAQYIPTTITAEAFDFPAWQDSELEGYYLIYAISSKGVKELYRYDANDQSYQRFEIPPEPENPNEVSNEVLQTIINMIADNLIIVLLITGLLLFLLLFLTIIFGVKLRNRNRELDDIYEEGVTAYSSSTFDQVEDEDEWDEDFTKDFKSKDQDMTVGMLDDGLTKAFDISMDDEIFESEGFVDYSKNDTITNDNYNDFEYANYSGFTQNKFTDNIGSYSKYQNNDDDDIEFIEI